MKYVEIIHDVANFASDAVARRLGFSEVRRQDSRLPLALAEGGTGVVWRLLRPKTAGGQARGAV